MCKAVAPYAVRLVARFAFAGATAALLAGCAETSRFTGDPLGNPFKTASTDPAPTGSLEPRASADDMAPPPYQPRGAVTSRPLAAPASSRVASYEAPRQSYAPPKPEFAAPSGHGAWTAQGGMSVTAADGETASILAARYNVPTEALVHANGFRSAADVRPGTRLVIPVYQAGGSRVAESDPRPHGRERLAKEHLAKTIADRKSEKAKREEVAERDEPRKGRRDDGDVMHWKKGAAPARMGQADPKTKAEDKRAALKAERDQAKADAKAERLAAKQQTKAERHKVATAEVHEAPAKPMREEVAVAPHKSQADTTPTASLPPAEEKVVSSGGPEFRWPAHGRIIQGFKAAGNDGINIAVPDGTPVKAAESGVVAYAGSEIKGFGNLVLIRHPNGFVTAYANNGNIAVKRGEQVKRGQTIAMSGQSGNVSSPQLHFEVRKGSTPVDPTRYLAGL